MESHRLLTAGELAAHLQIGIPRVYEMARRGLVPTIRLGRQVRFDPQQIESWIERGGTASLGDGLLHD